jgi:outer membrane protein TolC
LRLANDRDNALAERIEQGDLPAFERLDNARAIEQRKAQLAVAQRGVEQAAIDLSLMLRNEAGQPIVPAQHRLPDALPEPQTQSQPLTDLLALAKENRVEPKRFALQADSQEIERAFAKNQLLPGLDLQIAGSTDMGRAMPSRPDLSQPVLELSVFVDVPLQARVMRGRARAAEALANRSRLQLDYAHDTIASEVQDAFSALRVSCERIEAARNEVAAARELEEGERIRFAHGDSQLLIVNLREQQTAEARLREVEALLDHQRAHVMLKAARGELR